MDLVNRFLSFDKLMGEGLVKFVYFVGVVFLALGVLISMFSGFQGGFVSGLGSMLFAPIAGVFMLLFWRFICELYLVLFKVGNDLSAVRKSLEGGGTAYTVASNETVVEPEVVAPEVVDPEDDTKA